jgi:hypothetical protein
METENTKKMSGRTLTLLTGIIFLLVFIIYYTLMSLLGPGRKMAEMKKTFAPVVEGKNVIDERVYTDSAYLRLFHDRSFLQSRIAMAETDSIYLTLNISDSTANLEISGVAVHTAKMSEIKASRILTQGNDNIVLSLLATPFTIESSVATIMKEPVMVKMAPKDTSEFKPDIMPDTSLTEPVSYILNMTNGTRVYICQEETDGDDRGAIRAFDRQDRIKSAVENFKSVIRFKVPEYHPFIKIKLPRADAKIIYRAIPRYGQVGIYR